MKNTKIILIILLILGIVVFFYIFDFKKGEAPIAEDISESNAISLCYSYEEMTSYGFSDRAWLRLDLDGENVSGEYHNYPAQTDSKIGSFVGRVSAFDPNISGREAEVIWDSLAEGMQVREELIIHFGEGSATAFFGEMVEENEIYVYKNKNSLVPGFSLSQVDCDTLAERLQVEKYIRENIRTLSTKEPVLGGNWYVTKITLNTFENTGIVNYEDGHIDASGTFTYTYDKDSYLITITDFKIIR